MRHTQQPNRGMAERQLGLGAVLAMVIAMFVASTIIIGGPFHFPFAGLIKWIIALSLLRALLSALSGGDKTVPEVAAPQPATESAPLTREAMERAVLRVASENDGYVTPEALVLAGPGLTLKAAAELLDDLAVAGNCEVDADDDGHLTYRFRTSVGPARDTASPEQWLDQESRRMTGDRVTARGRLDA